MDKVRLGLSDVEVSRICMGCMGFGDPAQGMHRWTLGYEESRDIIRYGLEKGITFYDTAIGYQGGTSEQYVGKALNSLVRREDVQVATKFPSRPAAMAEAGITGQQYIEKMLDTSLKNLGMDYVDLYILHMWDYHTPLYEIMDGLNTQVKQGKVRTIGISNCFAWQLSEANALAEREGFAKFVSVQGHYNLIFREEEREMVPYCREKHISMTPYSALAAGRLSRKPGEVSERFQKDAFAKGKYDATEAADNVIIGRVAEIAEKHETTMTSVALAWLLTKVAAPVVGATKPHHVDGAAAAADLTLAEDEIRYLEEAYIPHALVGVMAQNS